MRGTRLFVTAALAAATALPLTAGPATAVERNPVIFVHGWNGSASNWNELVADFKADGYTDGELTAWNYNTSQSNKTTADQLSAVVDDVLARTGATEVDIVTHSMGGLNSRWYLKFVGGADKVDDWVSLAGPNHGTTSANTCFDASCVEMRPGSEFLTTLNDGDESPGAVSYGTWWSTCDETIDPDDSTVVSGARNTQTGCITHLGFLSDDGVSQDVRNFVA